MQNRKFSSRNISEKGSFSETNKVIEFFEQFPEIIEFERKIALNPAKVIRILRDTLDNLRTRREIKQRFVVGFIFWTGVRVNEFRLTKREDINLIAKIYNVPTLKRRKSSNRINIPLDHIPTKELEFWNYYFEEFNIKRDQHIIDVTDRQIRNIVKVFFRRNGIRDWKRIRVHSLRHALGLWLYETTKDIRLVAQVLRHATIRHTLVYVTLSLSEIREKAKRIKIEY